MHIVNYKSIYQSAFSITALGKMSIPPHAIIEPWAHRRRQTAPQTALDSHCILARRGGIHVQGERSFTRRRQPKRI